MTLRTAAAGGLGFSLLYLIHRLLQGTGQFTVDRRGPLLASEVAVGLALLAFIAFLAPLVPVVWQAGQEAVAVAIAVTGAVFLAMGFLSLAAETALIWVLDAGSPDAVLVLDQLQGRTPIVWTITALVAVVSLGVLRTGLAWRWLGGAGLVAAAVFGLGSVFSVFGREVEGGSSLIGVGLFIVWMLVLSAALWRSKIPAIMK